MTGRQRLSKAKLAEIARDYAAAFPGWTLYADDHCIKLWREEMPLCQNLWFDASESRYRILHDVTVPMPCLVAIGWPAPCVGMLSEFLGRPGSHLSSIRASEHGRRWRDAVAEMERDFRPDIRKPLDIAEVAQLCAPLERRDVQNDLVMMAVLYAWLGERDEAKRRCIRMQSLPSPDQADMIDWDKALKAFALDLLKAIDAGSERDQRAALGPIF